MTRAATTWRAWIVFAVFCVALMPLSSALAQSSGVEDPGAVGSGESHEKFACASDHADPSRKSRVGVPRVTLAKPVVLGALDRLLVERVAKHHLGELRRCYTRGLEKSPTAEGVVKVRFLVGPQGEVMVSHIHSDTTGSEELRVCLKREIAGWDFPKPKGSTVEVTYPIKFSLEDPDKQSSSAASYYSSNVSTSAVTDNAQSSQGFSGVGTAREDAVACDGGASSGGSVGDREIPKITARPVTVGPGGALSKEIIRRVIRKHKGELDGCYRRRMVRHSEGGKVKVEFYIDGKGSVTSAAIIDNTLNDGNVEDCLVAAVRTWQFPKPKGGGVVIVKYPFDFERVTPARLVREDAEREK